MKRCFMLFTYIFFVMKIFFVGTLYNLKSRKETPLIGRFKIKYIM